MPRCERASRWRCGTLWRRWEVEGIRERALDDRELGLVNSTDHVVDGLIGRLHRVFIVAGRRRLDHA
jgi:hypothetical protein